LGYKDYASPVPVSKSLDSVYAEGVSITHSNPHKHIWTCAVRLSKDYNYNQYNCPCAKYPGAKYPGPTPPPHILAMTITVNQETLGSMRAKRVHFIHCGTDTIAQKKTTAPGQECHGSFSSYR